MHMNFLSAIPDVIRMTKWVAQECGHPFSQFLYFHTRNDSKDTSYSFCSTLWCINNILHCDRVSTGQKNKRL